MKMRVQRRDGTTQTFHITQAFSILEGVDLDRIVFDDGTEHFFTKEGYYDGWGKSTSQSGESAGKNESQRKEKSHSKKKV